MIQSMEPVKKELERTLNYFIVLGVRDYIHVVDLAKGHLAAFKALDRRTGFQTFNLGTGTGTSVLEMVTAFRKASGQPIPTVDCPRRAGDVAWMWVSFQLVFYRPIFIFYFKSVAQKKHGMSWTGRRLPQLRKCAPIYGAFNRQIPMAIVTTIMHKKERNKKKRISVISAPLLPHHLYPRNSSN